MDERRIIIYEKPKLNKPYLLIGFEGWPDAGKVSSGAVSYLRDKLGVRELAEVAPDDFYLFQSPSDEIKRPVVDIQDGLVTGLSLPATKLWFYKNQGAGHDLIIMLGREPELRWNDYVNLILDLAQNFGVVRAYAIGGTYDVVPHTLAPMVVAVQDGNVDGGAAGEGEPRAKQRRGDQRAALFHGQVGEGHLGRALGRECGRSGIDRHVEGREVGRRVGGVGLGDLGRRQGAVVEVQVVHGAHERAAGVPRLAADDDVNAVDGVDGPVAEGRGRFRLAVHVELDILEMRGPIRQDGRDVVPRVVGATGLAYLVDHRGRVIAHRNIDLVSRRENLSDIAIVGNYLQAGQTVGSVPFKDRQGRQMLGAYDLVEMVELPGHPWFLASQFHPEFTSNPRDGHPLFKSFIAAVRRHAQGEMPEAAEA